jgi:hypothetical protein
VQRGTQGDDRGEHHGDVAARDDEEVRQPARAEVPFDRGIHRRVVTEREAEQEPALSRGEQGCERPPRELAHVLGPADRRDVGRTEPDYLRRLQLRDEASPEEERPEPIDRIRRRNGAVDPNDIAADRVERLTIAGDPDRLMHTERPDVRTHGPDVDDRRPPEARPLGVGAQGPVDRDAVAVQLCEDRAVQTMDVPRAPPHAECGDAEDARREGGHGSPDGLRSRRRSDRPHRRRIVIEFPEDAPAGGRETSNGDDQRRAPEREPGDDRQRLADAARSRDTQRERRGGGRQEPGRHTVTRSWMFARVASPMPLTSRSASTDVNGPFSVR